MTLAINQPRETKRLLTLLRQARIAGDRAARLILVGQIQARRSVARQGGSK